MIGADAMRVTAKGQPLCIGGSKSVSDLIGEDINIEWDGETGAVTGELKHVEGWQEFSNVPEEQEGNFFPITLDASYTGKPITVERTGGKAKTVVDRNWILRVPDTSTVFTFSVDGAAIFALDFSGATLTGAD